jgi:hypothetical protein
MYAASLAGMLADDGRWRVVSALLLDAPTLDTVAAATGLGTRAIVTALGRLVSGGLVVEGENGSYHIVAEAFVEAARSSRPPRVAAPADGGDEEAKRLRAFVRDGQLLSIPTARPKRRVILNRLAALFEPGIRYPEPVVNDVLRTWHPDTAALRRYLVDEEFLSRDHGEYWRSGGDVVVN